MKDIADLTPAVGSVREYVKEMRRTWEVVRWIWTETTTEAIRRDGKKLIVATFLMALITMLTPAALRYFFDALQYQNVAYLYQGVVAFGMLLVATVCAGLWHSRCLEWFAGTHQGKIDDCISRLFFEKSIGQHAQESSYLSASNIEKARGRILTVLGVLIFEAVPTLFSVGIAYLSLFFVSFTAGLVMTGAIAFYVAIMAWLNKEVFVVCTPIDKELRKLNRYRFSRWDNVPWVQINTKESHELEFPNAWFDREITKDRAFWIRYGKWAMFRHIIASLCFLGIMVYATFRAMNGGTAMSSLFLVASWCAFIVENLWKIGHSERAINYHIPSIRAMIDTLSIKPSVTMPADPLWPEQTDRLRVRFHDVSFEYDASRIEKEKLDAGTEELRSHVLRRVSFEIHPGEKVALIGESGAGKSTIMNLLLRGEDPKEGKITVNGIDLRDIDLNKWRSLIGYIPQQPVVFDGTLRDNLLYGLRSEQASRISAEELWAFAQKMKINFEGRLTHGLDTVVGRSGIKLSGGERQRISIAAAVLKKPGFMIIDEPTSSLDSLTERDVQEGIESALGNGVGALIIAHRLSTVRKCDKFIVLKKVATLVNGDSQIEAVGSSFEELYARSITFKQMADQQGLTIHCSSRSVLKATH